MKGYVYLIRNKDIYKIGITKNIQRRLNVLKPDEVLKVFKTNKYEETEKRLHKKYKEVRIPQTEYFRLTDSQVSECKRQLSIEYYRRAKSIPLIIAIAGFGSPITCIFWSIRHHSWSLGLIPISIFAISKSYYLSVTDNKLIDLINKLIISVIIFTISKHNKNKSL